MEYLCVMIMNPAIMAEPIKMPFDVWTWMARKNHVLDGGSAPHMRRGNFDGVCRRCSLLSNYFDHLLVLSFGGPPAQNQRDENWKQENANGCNDGLFGDDTVLEGDNISSLKSH